MKNIIWLPEIIIDSHCHGRDLNQKYKTTIRQTLLEAKHSLITTSCFMPNTEPPIVNMETLNQYLDIIAGVKSHLSLPEQRVWFGVTDHNLSACDQALGLLNVVGLKIYPKKKDGDSVTTGTAGVTEDRTILHAMKLCKKHNKVLAVHCDDPDIIAIEGNTVRAETTYVKKIIGLARKVPGVKIIICHVSCRESAELILWAQMDGLQIVIELAPHYLWFDAFGANWNTTFDPVAYKCFNSLRMPADREYLVSLLRTHNRLILIGSDNAPHTWMEKISKQLGGLPTNQELVPIICTLAREHNLSDERVAQLISLNASEFLNIQVSGKMKKYELIEKKDDLAYNHGVVKNPWHGSKLLFPYPV